MLWKAVLSHLFLWPTGSEWHCTFCERQSHHIFSYGQQQVSDIAHFVTGSLITPFPMANSKWVTLHILWRAVPSHLFLYQIASQWHYTFWNAVSSHLFLWPIACEWHCTFWNAVLSHLFLWPTGSVWHSTFCERWSHHMFSYQQQQVSDIAHLLKGSPITCFPLTNSLWVTLHTLWKAVSWYLFLSPTGGEWYSILCDRQSHHIFSYGQQLVSDMVHIVRQSQHIFAFNQQYVSDISHLVKGSLRLTSIPLTNRKWAASHFFALHSQYASIHECLIYHYILFIHIRKWAFCHIFCISSFYINDYHYRL